MPILIPSACVARVTDITPSLLRGLGAEAVLLDVDNTLAPDGSQKPFPGTVEWTKKIGGAGFKLMILSNNISERVAPFAAQYGLPFCAMAMKPLPPGYILAAGKMQVPRKRTIVVGDQIFTDVLGASLAGMKSILVEPETEEDSLSFRIRRRLERPIRRKLSRRAASAKDEEK